MLVDALFRASVTGTLGGGYNAKRKTRLGKTSDRSNPTVQCSWVHSFCFAWCSRGLRVHCVVSLKSRFAFVDFKEVFGTRLELFWAIKKKHADGICWDASGVVSCYRISFVVSL